ncbi:MAG: alpha/beta hydrolase [Gemmataceae bacterium]|nr:alpha/beta hydrolase [Gemmataceae bacterium]MCI0741365.1 alpha/beta hydrolase [Gemmataceae bacterium]
MDQLAIKTLPVPSTVSSELQQAIAAPLRTDILVRPKSVQEWRKIVQEADGQAAQVAQLLWKQLGLAVTPSSIAGVQCFRLVPQPPLALGLEGDRLLVHLHGGAYVFNGGEAATCEAALVAHCSKTSVLSVDYRMPPDHPFPAALDDAVAVWQALVKDHDPAKMALFGTSAGAGLAMAAVLKLKETGTSLPAALYLGTPWVDLTKTGDTFFTNDRVDNILVTYDGLIEAAAMLYAGGRDLNDPLLSPVYGDLHGFPPTILISGTRDLFLSLTVRAHRKLRQAGVPAELHVFEGVSHAQFLTSFPSPESLEALEEVASYFDRHLTR